MKHSLAVRIGIALVLGILTGLLFTGNPEPAVRYLRPIGTIFLNLIRFIVVPIVFFSILSGILSMKDLGSVGRIGLGTLVFYFCTTALAVALGLGLATLFRPFFPVLELEGTYTSAAPTDWAETLVGLFPDNIISPFAEAAMLQVILAALLFGYGALRAGDKGHTFTALTESVTQISIAVMDGILQFSPIGVFAMIAPVVAENGPAVLGSLGMVLLCAYLGYLLHSLLVYGFTIWVLAGLSPLAFFRGMGPAMMLAFSSASSVGTLPLNLECVERLGAKRDVASFVLPLGATLNMDGTAIYQGVCAVFIAACCQVELTPAELLTIVLTATLASIGTAGVPGAGTVMLTMVLESVGLPVAGIGLVLGVDRIFDMGRTVVNITGDAACALVISARQKKRRP